MLSPRSNHPAQHNQSPPLLGGNQYEQRGSHS